MTLKCIMCGKEKESDKRHAICICGNMMYRKPEGVKIGDKTDAEITKKQPEEED